MLKANQKKHEWNLLFSHFLKGHISSDAKIRLTKKITQRLLCNMEEARLCSWACFGASGTAGLEISRVSRHPGVKRSLQKAPVKPQTVEAVFS